MPDPVPTADGGGHLLTAPDVARICSIHVKTIYAWAARGELPSIRLGRRAVRFRRQDIDQLIRDGLVPVGKAAAS